MKKRRSINGSRARHENPIPNACRLGNIVMSSVIGGSNPGTRELPPTLEQQVANVFGYIRHDVEAAGGTVDDVIKITFWVKDAVQQRAALNDEWVKMFPDPARGPPGNPASTGRQQGYGAGRLHWWSWLERYAGWLGRGSR
jgi:enamine deaminase RidA (YjgF/YER057c/UK114 family)